MSHHNLLLYVSIPFCFLTPFPCHIPTHTSPHMHTLTCPHLSFHTCAHLAFTCTHLSPYTHIFTCTHLSFTHPHISPLHSQIAAQSLREVTDEFLEEGNPIITVAKKMSQQMFQMAEFTHGRGELQVSTFPSVHLFTYLSLCLSTCICASIYSSVHLSVRLSVCLSVCLPGCHI